MAKCVICDEVMSKQKNLPVICCFCEFEACRSCCATYMLDQTVARCMNNNCEKDWNRKFITDKFAKSFVTGPWKQNLEQVLYDREKSLLPATQGVVSERKESKRIRNEIVEVDLLMSELKLRRRTLEQERHGGGSVRIADAKHHFVRACPDEHCRGYLSTHWKCGLCDKSTCADCHVLKGSKDDGPHVCNHDDLATAKLLDKDTKPCPKCATGIFKIDGCDQMWCTQCHTAFGWKSGRIETQIHNPHYHEFMRRTNAGAIPRNLGDNLVCGQELTHTTAENITRHLRERGSQNHFHETSIHCIVDSVLHLANVQADAYRVNQIEDNLELRVNYLLEEIDETTFKTKIQRANKNHEKKSEISQIIQLFISTVTEIVLRLQRYVRSGVTKLSIEDVRPYFNEIHGIRLYANECLVTICAAFMSQPKEIRFYDCTWGRTIGTAIRNNGREQTTYTREVLCNPNKVHNIV